MRLSEIERISASDFTGADTLSRGLIAQSSLPGLRPLTGDLLYYVNRYGSRQVTLGIWARESPKRVRHVGELGVQRNSDLPGEAYQVSYITVHRKYRGQGLARLLYQLYFLYVSDTLVAGSSQTPGGRLMWKMLYEDPGYEVVGLIGLNDEMFDYWEELSEFRKWINNLMAIGAEHQGESAGYQWFAVPLRAMRRELNILKGFQLYNRSDGDTPDLITTLMARRRGAQ